MDQCSSTIKSSGSNLASNSSYYYVPQINPTNGLSHAAVRNILRESVIDSDGKPVSHISNNMMHSVLNPMEKSTMMCCAWLRDYCSRFTDQDPTNEDCFSPMDSKKDVYREYKESSNILLAAATGIPDVGLQTFLLLWRKNFPHLKLRKSCNICGKCEICSRIDEGSKNSGNCEALKEMYRNCKLCHRVLYKGERKAAADRLLHALAHPTEILHIDIDIMDSQGLSLPHAGKQNQFKTGIKSVLIGALVAGVGATLYRTIDTYSKSKDLIVQVLLLQVDEFMARNGKPPTLIYINVDGGSENANTLMLFMCELLVAKGLSLSIIYTRLPTGHTHNGGDGIFGLIKMQIRSRPMWTWEVFKEILEETLGNTAVKLTVTDIFFVFDYEAFMKPYADTKLASFAKLEDTMHQWKFERCENNHHYPLNVITMYRAFAADETIVTKFVSQEEAKSSLGRQTGMDHYLMQVKWYPDRSSIENRPVQGFYLLHDLPNIDPTLMPLKEFNVKGREDLLSVLDFIRNKWPDASDSTRMSWELFFSAHLPVGNGSVGDFIHEKGLRHPTSPMCKYLARRDVVCGLMERKVISPMVSRRIEYIPEVLAGVAVAMPSVTTEFDKNCLPPRLYAEADPIANAVVEEYCSSESHGLVQYCLF